MNEAVKKEMEYYKKQYEKAHKELEKECDNLKKLIEELDPMDIDFDTKVKEINNLKEICDSLHFKVKNREFAY